MSVLKVAGIFCTKARVDLRQDQPVGKNTPYPTEVVRVGPNSPIQLDELAIIGTGLIGSSVARAARARGVAQRIVGVDHSAVHREQALALGIVDEAFTELEHAATA